MAVSVEDATVSEETGDNTAAVAVGSVMAVLSLVVMVIIVIIVRMCHVHRRKRIEENIELDRIQQCKY